MALNTVIAVMTDLFFLIQVTGAAKPLGLQVVCVKDKATALDKLNESPATLIVDLTCHQADPIALIEAAKAAHPALNVIGFLPHVQTELRQRALDAGADHVLPRSTFAQNLPKLLAR